jgi:hypothetical protein
LEVQNFSKGGKMKKLVKLSALALVVALTVTLSAVALAACGGSSDCKVDVNRNIRALRVERAATTQGTALEVRWAAPTDMGDTDLNEVIENMKDPKIDEDTMNPADIKFTDSETRFMGYQVQHRATSATGEWAWPTGIPAATATNAAFDTWFTAGSPEGITTRSTSRYLSDLTRNTEVNIRVRAVYATRNFRITNMMTWAMSTTSFEIGFGEPSQISATPRTTADITNPGTAARVAEGNNLTIAGLTATVAGGVEADRATRVRVMMFRQGSVTTATPPVITAANFVKEATHTLATVGTIPATITFEGFFAGVEAPGTGADARGYVIFVEVINPHGASNPMPATATPITWAES